MEKKKICHSVWRGLFGGCIGAQKKKGMVRSVDVARHMGVSKPSVCHAVVTLKKGGFSHYG